MKFSNKLYDTLKWICLIAIPAFGGFLNELLPIFDVAPDKIQSSIRVIFAVGTLIGALIGISTASYNKGE